MKEKWNGKQSGITCKDSKKQGWVFKSTQNAAQLQEKLRKKYTNKNKLKFEKFTMILFKDCKITLITSISELLVSIVF